MRVPRVQSPYHQSARGPVRRVWAPLNGTLEHVGRKSGKTYQTPLNIFETADGFVVPMATASNLIGYKMLWLVVR